MEVDDDVGAIEGRVIDGEPRAVDAAECFIARDPRAFQRFNLGQELGMQQLPKLADSCMVREVDRWRLWWWVEQVGPSLVTDVPGWFEGSHAATILHRMVHALVASVSAFGRGTD